MAGVAKCNTGTPPPEDIPSGKESPRKKEQDMSDLAEAVRAFREAEGGCFDDPPWTEINTLANEAEAVVQAEARVLSPGEAFALGDVLNAITQHKKIRWMDANGEIRSGELRSLVRGQNDFHFAEFGTDVRDMWVWITANGMEITESVAHLVKMLPEGGLEIIAEDTP